MLQSVWMRALFVMKTVIGEMKRSHHRIGISFTFIQNAVNIPRITRMFKSKSTPQKLSLEMLTETEKRLPRYQRKAAPTNEMPIRGTIRLLSG